MCKIPYTGAGQESKKQEASVQKFFQCSETSLKVHYSLIRCVPGEDLPVVVKPCGVAGDDDMVRLLRGTLLPFKPTPELPSLIILILEHTHTPVY